MERILATGQLAAAGRLRAGDGPLSVGFVQCAGSRDARHLAYCSGVCCAVTLKQIVSLKEHVPEARCVIFYTDIRAAGTDELLYQRAQALPDVVFVRANPAAIRPEDGEGRLRVRVEDTLSGREVRLTFDLLVLAGGLVPSEGTAELGARLGLPPGRRGVLGRHLPGGPR